MKYLILFPFYKECPIFDVIVKDLQAYSGPYKFDLRKGQGTIVHDVRNALLTQSIKINKESPELPDYEGTIWIDSDIECSLDDVIHLIQLKKNIVGLPYTLRGDQTRYNAGYIKDGDFIHSPTSETGLKKVDGQGMGFRYISMKVFKKMTPFWFWPSILEHNGKIQTLVEDWAFDLKARQLGFDVWTDFNRPVGHNTKEQKMNPDQKMNLEQDFRRVLGGLSEIGIFVNKMADLITQQNKDLIKEQEKRSATLIQLDGAFQTIARLEEEIKELKK
jgi:hypothetical protein